MPAPKQQAVTIEELNQTIWNHMEARDWHKNAPRGVAISMALEASELLEHYQWDDQPVGGTDAVGEELADIFIYGIQFAQINNIDIVDHIQRKLEKAAKKYPAEDFKGKNGDEMRDTWLKNKLSHQKTGL
jgi:NTP pyrophosphatase (non-canonical NTP hydrolase)